MVLKLILVLVFRTEAQLCLYHLWKDHFSNELFLYLRWKAAGHICKSLILDSLFHYIVLYCYPFTNTMSIPYSVLYINSTSGRVCTSIIFKIVLTILVLLSFYVNFRISSLHLPKVLLGILWRLCWIYRSNTENWCHDYIESSSQRPMYIPSYTKVF